MKQDNSTILIVGIILAIAFLYQYSPLFSIYDYEKTITFNEIEGVVKSTREFGKTSIDHGGHYDISEHYINEVPNDKFSINLHSYVTSKNSKVGGQLGDTETYIITKNLQISPNNLEKLDILFEQENSRSCLYSDNWVGKTGWSSISLIGPEELVLFKSKSPGGFGNPSSSKSGIITLESTIFNSFLITLGDETTIIDNLSEGIYELKILAKAIPDCGTDGYTKESISIKNINIEYKESIGTNITNGTDGNGDTDDDQTDGNNQINGDDYTGTDQIVCTQDVKECSDGSFVGRNPDNNCEFYECPKQSFLDKYGLAGFILIILGGIIIYLIIKRK